MSVEKGCKVPDAGTPGRGSKAVIRVCNSTDGMACAQRKVRADITMMSMAAGPCCHGLTQSLSERALNIKVAFIQCGWPHCVRYQANTLSVQLQAAAIGDACVIPTAMMHHCGRIIIGIQWQLLGS